ncbi:MAG: hypothetical protein LBU58_12330, partial [Clostridiales bacterium]|nr:hypothetical protein [Clostridiales bacterium]
MRSASGAARGASAFAGVRTRAALPFFLLSAALAACFFLAGACGAGGAAGGRKLYSDMKLGADATATPTTGDASQTANVPVEPTGTAVPAYEAVPAHESAPVDTDAPVDTEAPTAPQAAAAPTATPDLAASAFSETGNPSPVDFAFSQAEIDQMDTKKIGWGAKHNGHGQPEIAAATRALFSKTNTVFIGGADEPVLYLTFDAGYENGYTASILDTLNEN